MNTIIDILSDGMANYYKYLRNSGYCEKHAKDRTYKYFKTIAEESVDSCKYSKVDEEFDRKIELIETEL